MKKILLSLCFVFCLFGAGAQTSVTDTIYPFKVIKDPLKANRFYVLSENTNEGYSIENKQHLSLVKASVLKKTGIVISYNTATESVNKLIPFNVKRKSTADTSGQKRIESARKAFATRIPIDSIPFIFQAMVDQGCPENTPCQKDQICLTFRFKKNGCNARAHWMVKLLEERFSYSAEKIFSSGRLFAKNDGNCGASCIAWGWHVAPIITAVKPDGTEIKLVIDPSLFPQAVSVEDWNSALEQESCNSRGKKGQVTETVITGKDIYTPNGSKDPFFSDTRRLLNKFCKECS